MKSSSSDENSPGGASVVVDLKWQHKRISATSKKADLDAAMIV